jgi:hypothetical protein
MKVPREKVVAPVNMQAVSSKEHRKKCESTRKAVTYDESTERRQLKKMRGYQRKMHQTWMN